MGLGRGQRLCKGPDARVRLVCLRDRRRLVCGSGMQRARGEWRPMRVARWAGTSPRDGEERLGFYSRGSGSYRRD